MIVGTAGHIDHGKTTLVRALTGVDTDRLKEEKARGISIELGYAYAPLDDGSVLGFVDVPGHERLVHTMVAGAAGIDFALLVVAADDGVMPQTREHLAILDLLGVGQGAVALTKADCVDAARLQQVQHEVQAALASTPLAGAPVFALNATAPDHPGTAALLSHLQAAAAAIPPRRDDGLFRLAVDRVFTLAGHGVIATGTVFSGRASNGEPLSVMPAGLPVRVRGIHAQNRVAQSGRAGQRCALNVTGVARDAIARGDWLADPRLFAASTRIDVRLRLLPASGVHLASWSPLHVHLGTLHQVAHVVLLESDTLPAGETGRVQLVFDKPVCVTPGDRFIARDAQAAHTIGGGVVVDPAAPSRRRRSAERRRYLDALELMIGGGGIEPLLEQARNGLPMADLVRLTGRAPEHVPLPADAVVMEAAQERCAFHPSRWRELRAGALEALRAFHARAPDEPGPDVGRLRRIVRPELSPLVWRRVVDDLVAGGNVQRNGPWLHLPEHRAQLTDEDRKLAGQLQPLVAAGRFDPPWVRDLARALHEPEDRVRRLLRRQVSQGAVCQVVHDLFYDRARVDELADIVARLALEHGEVTAAAFRDAIGLGRKRAIQILEFFDRVGYTRRVRDAHVLRMDSGWNAARS